MTDGSFLRDIPAGVVQAAIEEERARLALTPGITFITAGTPTPGLYLIVQGTVELYVRDAEDQEKVLDFATTNDVLAAETLFNKYPVHYSVRALTTGQAIHLPEPLVADWVVRYPAFGKRLMALIAQRIDYLFKDMLTLRTKKATARLVCYLVCHFDKAPRTPDGTHSLQIDIPKNRLASRLGISDSHLSRALRELQDQGLLVSRVAGTSGTIETTGAAGADTGSGYFIPDVAALSKYVCPMGCVL